MAKKKLTQDPTQRLAIQVRTDTMDISSVFEGTLAEVKAKFDAMLEKYKAGAGETEHVDISYYGYDGGFEVEVKYFRQETDAEYATRQEALKTRAEKKRKQAEAKLASAKKKLEEAEAEERAVYEQFKKKFESTEVA